MCFGLIKTTPLSTHNISFAWEIIRKMIFHFAFLSAVNITDLLISYSKVIKVHV